MQRWISSLCSRTPSQKPWLSRLITGRGRRAAGGRSCTARWAGANLRIRKRWVPHGLAVRPHVHPGRHEVAGAELGRLARGDRLDHCVEGDGVPGAQRAQVLLLAVGGDHRGAPRAVQEREELVVGAGAVAVSGEAAHRPDLQHGGRGDRVRAGVGGIGVTHRLAPMTDHRFVHEVLGAASGGGGAPFEVFQQRVEPGCLLGVPGRVRGHRFLPFMPSRIMATISRWTSLTPPPKVLIWAARFIRSSSPPAKPPALGRVLPLPPPPGTSGTPRRWTRCPGT